MPIDNQSLKSVNNRTNKRLRIYFLHHFPYLSELLKINMGRILANSGKFEDKCILYKLYKCWMYWYMIVVQFQSWLVSHVKIYVAFLKSLKFWIIITYLSNSKYNKTIYHRPTSGFFFFLIILSPIQMDEKKPQKYLRICHLKESVHGLFISTSFHWLALLIAGDLFF